MLPMMIKRGNGAVEYLNPMAVVRWRRQRIRESPSCVGTKREGCCVEMLNESIIHEVHMTPTEFAQAWRVALGDGAPGRLTADQMRDEQVRVPEEAEEFLRHVDACLRDTMGCAGVTEISVADGPNLRERAGYRAVLEDLRNRGFRATWEEGRLIVGWDPKETT